MWEIVWVVCMVCSVLCIGIASTWPNWIGHPPTKREIAGSSPVVDFFFCLSHLHNPIHTPTYLISIHLQHLSHPLPLSTLSTSSTLPTTLHPLHTQSANHRSFLHTHYIHSFPSPPDRTDPHISLALNSPHESSRSSLQAQHNLSSITPISDTFTKS